ncbi:MAG: PadR family transcriptional regulator [bacterium]|nr:PadR family transcriptional regulator [bacterium]
MNLKGTLPLLILKILQGGPLHGYAIAQRIRARSDGLLDFKEGSLYPALHSQENRGLIESVEREEKGRVRRCYRLTERGRRALKAECKEWEELSTAVSLILEGGR